MHTLFVLPRMAVKLTVDSEVIGPATSQEELHDYLDAYDRDWYIGCDGDRGWKSAVRSGKPHCFSLARDEIKVCFNFNNPLVLQLLK